MKTKSNMTVKDKPKELDWESEYFRRYQDGLWSDPDSLAVDKSGEVKEFITELLTQQRTELLEEILGLEII